VTGNKEAQEWTTELTERDRLFIDKLGMNSDTFGTISKENE
jgi:hypothetical protein